jgi:hypothetical protein
MIKMERTCSSLRCNVVYNGKLIGRMEGVSLTQWFLKNKYSYKGSFSKFITENPADSCSGIIVDIIFLDRKLIAKDAKIGWIRAPGKNGTFHASKIEYYDTD